MTLLAHAVVALLVAAEPPTSTAAPTSLPPAPSTPSSTPTRTSPSPSLPPDAEWVSGSGERTAPAAAPSPPPTYRPRVAVGREWSIGAGWNATGLMGLTAIGAEIRLGFGKQPLATATPALPVVTVDLFAGETGPGLAVRSLSLGGELWSMGGRVRVGGGLGMGIVGYRRATSGEWPLLLTLGVRGGVELALFRLGGGALVLGAHGAANAGPWFSGALTVGYRGEGRAR